VVWVWVVVLVAVHRRGMHSRPYRALD
jgi:hypothetical protein